MAVSMLFSHSVFCPHPARKNTGSIASNVARRNTRGVFKYFFIFFIPFAILFSSERSSLFL